MSLEVSFDKKGKNSPPFEVQFDTTNIISSSLLLTTYCYQKTKSLFLSKAIVLPRGLKHLKGACLMPIPKLVK